MEYLAHSGANGLHECLRRIYSNSDINIFHANALSALSQIIPSTIASYNEVYAHEGRRPTFITTSPSAVTPKIVSAFNHYMYEHPYINFLYPKTMQSHPFRKRIEKFRHSQKIDYNRFPKSRALKISDMVTPNQFHSLSLYNEYYKRLDTKYQMVMPLVYSRSLLSGFAFNRDTRDFSEEERLMLNLLAPHMIQAYQNAEAAAMARQEAAILDRAMEEASYGVIALDMNGRIRFQTPKALRLLTEFFKIPPSSPRCLPRKLELWVKYNKSLLALENAIPPPLAPLALENERACLTIRFIKSCQGADDLILLCEEPKTLFMKRLEPFGLTARETEVFRWLARGKSNAEISLICNITRHTVKKHLEKIYQKMGVENRLAACMLANNTKI
ncbi:MAG: helix-turn-helix transcriptional regulator [Deltaproteobacteria bacterium]|nr:helix-turn-helix transcriptional regulator [Deltaproteobacteria bacterium]